MMKKPNLNNTPLEVIEYIGHLEAQLYGSSNLMKSINVASDVIAEEILEITAKGSLMSNDKSFDKIMTLIEKSAKVRALSEPKKKEVKEAKEAEEIQAEEEEPVTIMKNISDLAKKKHAN